MYSESRQKLQQIYRLHAAWADAFEFACQKGCAACCTRGVSLTTLEAELILEYMKSVRPELLPRTATLPPIELNHPTTNEFAAACLRCEEMTNDDDNRDLRPCLFLEGGYCTIYPVRPFMCRSMGSKVPCHRGGAAEMDPLFLTLNTVMMQCIEHIDRGRPWGNLHTILKLATGIRTDSDNSDANCFRISQAIPGFLIPPDESYWIREHLLALRNLLD